MTARDRPQVVLERATHATWAAAALAEPIALLIDHAHCELGAAASAQALIHSVPSDHELVERMGALAMEELAHFRMVVRLLDELGGTLSLRIANPYVAGLDQAARASRGGGPKLLDRLLVAALVEARSFERFELLAAAAGDPRLARLYGELGPSERGHMLLFPELARQRFGADAVGQRLAILARAEAELVARLPFAARVHSGDPIAAAAAT